MPRPKRVIANETNMPAASRARVGLPPPEELGRIVMQLQAQSLLDAQMWTAVEAAFDTHADRLEYLSHQDLQWNDDFATTVDAMKKAIDSVDAKVGQQVGQQMMEP